MQEVQDTELLRQYVRQNSDEAFAALVTRHVNMIYSAALRKAGNPAAAEEITQAVFIILARKADKLLRHAALSGWLYQSARLTAANFLRTEIRRARREQEAYMQSLSNQTESEVWPQIMPLLEDAMGRLGEKDRNAIALRFFEGKSFREIGTAFGASENAAKKRIAYALEKLRTYFSKHGVTSTTEAITGAISANSVQAAPVALAKTATAVALAKGATASTSTLTLIKGALKAITWTKYKFAVGIAAGLLLAGSAVTIAVTEKNSSAQPDPVALLKKVAAAREKIKSGEMEFIVARHDYKWNIRTNYALLKVAFDGEKRRFEQLQRESAYVSMNPETNKLVDAKRVELGGDDDALAQMGLIKFFDAHYRTIYDGKIITQFDPPISQTKILDPKGGISQYLFDPRTFGLSAWFFIEDTVDSCLTYQAAKSVLLIGRETIGGIACWHIQTREPMIVDSTRNLSNVWKYDFWIDIAHPQRVIKVEDPNRGGIIISRYDDQNPNDPLPVEIDVTQHFGGDPRPWETRIIRKNARYNVPIESKAFTLAGLGMPVGTDIVDYRISRSIGYWNGKSLSENFPRNAPRRKNNPISIMENDPKFLLNIKTDKSFVDERKIVLRRTEIATGLLIVIFIGGMVIRQFRKKACQ
ncbi:MAG: sigma-70 family RNA polymerase sigma factor [Limisphaerales bacterium]